jgi:hypothetical protein
VLIAVPTAAVIGVLTRFAIQQYGNSAYYKDLRARKASEGAWPILESNTGSGRPDP